MVTDIKLIAMDMDGTLLDSQKKVSEAEIRALRACRDRGVELCLSSGRSFEALTRFARAMGIENMLIISCNGARMDRSASGPILYENNLPENIAREAAGRLIRAGLYVECYSDERIYMANRRPLPTRSHQPGLTPDRRVEFIDSNDGLIGYGSKKARKLIVFTDDTREITLGRELLRDLPLSLSQSSGDCLEILNRGAGKGDLLRRYMADTGLSPENVMAFGDENNDLDMLASVYWSVAMGNAIDEVKAACRLTAPDNDRDGVANTIDKYVLGGEGI